MLISLKEASLRIDFDNLFVNNPVYGNKIKNRVPWRK